MYQSNSIKMSYQEYKTRTKTIGINNNEPS